LFSGGGADACASFVCEVDDENNNVFLGCMTHRIEARWRVLGLYLVSGLASRLALCQGVVAPVVVGLNCESTYLDLSHCVRTT